MPATEQTWRDQKWLHVVFGISSVLMLIVSVWTLAVDHDREWKPVQRKFREIETWFTEAKIRDQDSPDYGLKSHELEQSLANALLDVPSPQIIQDFAAEAKTKADANRYKLGTLEQDDLKLRETAQPAFMAARGKLVTQLESLEAATKVTDGAPAAPAAAADASAPATDAAKKDELLELERKQVAALATDVLHAANEGIPPQDGVNKLVAAATSLAGKVPGVDAASVKAIQTADGEMRTAYDTLVQQRQTLLDAMDGVQRQAKFDEDNRFSRLKFRRADLDVERSRYNLGVGEGLPEAELEERQEGVKRVEHEVEEMTHEYEQAKTHRLALDDLLKRARAPETAARKVLDGHLGLLAQLKKAKKDRQLTAVKEVLDAPILEGFNSPLKIEQIWLPKLTFNNNFKDVARFDRCTTCHQAIDKAGVGGTAPAYPPRPDSLVAVTLKPPAEAPAAFVASPPANDAQRDAQRSEWLQRFYGLEFAERGLMHETDVTISVVRPLSPGADAQLQVGDVVRFITDVRIDTPERAYRYLVDSVAWGKPIQMRVERGLPHPFSTHPRLDLFLGSTSPHKATEMGCTICHEGQGSGTSFQWASHTPNTPHQAKEWKEDHGWFNNHHWIYPMRPDRFIESSCLKCHHEVTELEPSERFPDPPAPKLMEGYNIVRQYGCFSCHEINGYDGPSRRRGPDMRVEPSYAAAAAQVLADPQLDEQEKQLAHDVVDHPERTDDRKLLAELINQDFARKQAQLQPAKATEADAAEGDAEAKDAGPARLSEATHRMASLLGADDETPGKYRKVGPSLRYVKSKLGADFLSSWIADPVNFRPATRMPKFFGLTDHLHEIKRDHDGRPQMQEKKVDGQTVLDDEGNPVLEPVYEPSHGLELTKKFEPVEVRAAVGYLLNSSQPFKYLEKPAGVTESPSAERGKVVFNVRGCLACHQHADFPNGKATQGPDLSRIGDKLTTPEGAQWLYSWVREPNHYHGRTVMPDLFLDPVEIPAKDGAAAKVTDPAADVTAFLLGSHQDWKPAPVAPIDSESLDKLATEYLAASFTNRQIQDYLEHGIPADLRNQVKIDEQLLVRSDNMTREENQQHKLLYVGRRTIGRLGCAACHDIPGFEDAKAIGTGLADWGRKEPSKLAFEQVVQYLAQQNFVHGDGHVHNIEQALNPHSMDPDMGYFVEKVVTHEREGFIWQKLREPRSYDYRMTENKPYIDRLRMPKFNLSAQQSEAAITFVLGLVAEPPAAQYVYKPDPRRQAIVQGERLVNKFNCNGCHTFAMEKWEFDYDPKTFAAPGAFAGYPFEMPHFPPKQIAESLKVDRRGLGHAKITGMLDAQTGGEEEDPENYVNLWEPVVINGHPWLPGAAGVPMLQSRITKHTPPDGGDFARLLQPIALAMEQAGENPNAKELDSWGWVPPPLIGEGAKVQTAWLHDFLLNPYRIRPAVILRMPRFNMSSEEASQFANYFAAVDNAQYPYQLDHRTESSYLAAQDAKHPERLKDALQFVASMKYCVSCHKLGDFTPPGSTAAMGPNLDHVYDRLRGDWLQVWLAKPKRLLPYTPMPENFLAGQPPESQELFSGTKLEQLEGVEDLLLNYDTYMKNRTSIKPMIRPASPTDQPAGGQAADGPASSDKSARIPHGSLRPIVLARP